MAREFYPEVLPRSPTPVVPLTIGTAVFPQEFEVCTMTQTHFEIWMRTLPFAVTVLSQRLCPTHKYTGCSRVKVRTRAFE